MSHAVAAGLRIEYLVDPLGLGETHPQLSWMMQSKSRGDKQTSYQVVVASSPLLLSTHVGDLWNSGIVKSSESAYVEYGGKILRSRQHCWWQVRIWDKDGKPTDWSAPSYWTMGLLQPSDWHANWIEAPAVSSSTNGVTIVHAFYEAVDRSVSMDVTQTVTGLIGAGQTANVSNETFGKDPDYGTLKHLRIDFIDNGKPGEVVLPEGQAITLNNSVPLPYFRKSFALSKPVASAMLYVTALGLYEISINGARVGDHIFAPEWTDYGKRDTYQVYDVTSLLTGGENAIGAFLANGWYCGHLGNGGFQQYGTTPALLAQLEVRYADGSTSTTITDSTWKCHNGPILSTDFMLGENYDARAEIADWDLPTCQDGAWQSVVERPAPVCSLVAQISEPVRQTGTVTARTATQTSPGKWTFDLGQNITGVVRIRVEEPAGTQITLRHAEMLNPDGTVYTANLRGATSIDTYICKGVGIEIWQPRFTFHGFRYVEVSGLTAPPSLGAVTGIVVGSDTSRTGSFKCSDPRINQLVSNIQWGQRDNYLSVPTDCPQRDERLGWMGDAEVFVKTATMNADVAAFFTKWLTDVDDAQDPDGAFTDVSPRRGSGEGTPAWSDAGVICPWTIYCAYGDKRILKTHLSAMTAFVEWCRANSTDLIRDHALGQNYGDWLAIGADTPKDLIGTAYFAYSTHLLAKSYGALGDTAGEKKYEDLFEQIRSAFDAKYVNADGTIESGTQCAYAMALKFELLPLDLRAAAAQNLRQDVIAKDWHLSTGFVGVNALLPALTSLGDVDTAYRLIEQDTFPSWLFSVKNGATTIWERWDGWTPEHGFQDPSMNSFNHYSLGSCGEWLYDTVAGIQWDESAPGYKHIVIYPQVGGSLTNASATIGSMYGDITSGWTIANGQITLNITIPPNTTATVHVPSASAAITESGAPGAKSPDVRFVRIEGNCTIYEVGSGTYHFAAPYTAPADSAPSAATI